MPENRIVGGDHGLFTARCKSRCLPDMGRRSACNAKVADVVIHYNVGGISFANLTAILGDIVSWSGAGTVAVLSPYKMMVAVQQGGVSCGIPAPSNLSYVAGMNCFNSLPSLSNTSICPSGPPT